MAGCRGCTTYIEDGVGTTRRGTGTRDNPFAIDVTGGGGGGGGGDVPTGGTTGQALRKDSGTDLDTSWQDVHEVPTGGTTSQVLRKNSGTAYDHSWSTTREVPAVTGVTDGNVLTKSGSTYAWAASTGSVDLTDMIVVVEQNGDGTWPTGLDARDGRRRAYLGDDTSEPTTGGADGTATGDFRWWRQT